MINGEPRTENGEGKKTWSFAFSVLGSRFSVPHSAFFTEVPMPSPLLALTSISTALAMGLVPGFFRSSQVFLRERLPLSEYRLDRLNQLLILSWVPLMPLAGWLSDRWGVREVLFTGSLVLGLAV